jgi:hypothetical protein
MSEPTNDGKQKPDPDPDRDPEKDPNEIQDQIPESVFNDPTAPVWADPTAPIPAPPPPPGAAVPQSDEPAANPQANPPPPPPMSNPYAQQQPAQPYGQPQPGQQYPAYSQPYGQPQPGQQYPAYSQQPYATGPHTEPNASAIVLTILSGIVMLSTCFIIGIPSLIFGIMALTSNSTDPVRSRKKAKTGWIVFAVNFGVVVLLVVAGFAILIATGNDLGSNTNFSY